MRAAVAGDAVAYRELLQELSRWLRALARARAGDSGLDVEDVVQETLLAIHLKRHTWREDEPVGPWVSAIARNKLVDQFRRRNRRSELPLDESFDEVAVAAAGEDAGSEHDVARALASLNERQRDIVRLVAIEGHSAREAALRLGMSEGALRVALHRCLKGLAATFGRERS